MPLGAKLELIGPVAGLPKPNQMLSMTNLRSIAYEIACRTLTLSNGFTRVLKSSIDDRRLHLVALGRRRDARQPCVSRATSR